MAAHALFKESSVILISRFSAGWTRFYVARCQDEYIVTQGPYWCPMLHLAKGKTGISHKQILKNAQEAIGCACMIEEVNWPIERLNLEKEILAASKAFLEHSNYLDFAAYQMSVTTKSLDLAEIRARLFDSVVFWKSFLRVDGLNFDNKKLAKELTAMTSLLRLENIQLKHMPVDRVPLALLALYFYILLFTKTNKPKTYFQIYMEMLNDIALGLLFLEKDDLRLKNKPLEAKISYLRRLEMLNTARALEKLKIQQIQGRFANELDAV